MSQLRSSLYVFLKIAALGWCLGISSPASAITLSTSSGQFGSVNISTGVFTPLISNSNAFTDIAISDEGSFFGTTFSRLYSIDSKSGESTLIGDLGINDMNALAFDQNNHLFGLSANGNFYAIDTSTGKASLITLISSCLSAGDLVFSTLENQFLMTSRTPINSTLFSLSSDGKALPIGLIGSENVYGLGFNQGILYGYTANGKQLVINPSTGAVTSSQYVTGVEGEIYGAASSLDIELPSYPSEKRSADSGIQPTRRVPEPDTLQSLVIFGGISIYHWWSKRR